jgi:hypothetical protein
VGSIGGLRLGKGDSGEDERGRRGGWLVLQGILLQVFFSFYIAQDLHASSLPPSKHYKTKRRGTATVLFRPKVCEGAGGINGVVW